MINDVLANANAKMKKSNDILRRDLGARRTGHATPALLEQVKVDYQGVPTPIKHIANISVPEARMLMIQPWDKSALGKIEKAIQKSNLSLNPANDGNAIRVIIPPLTDEQRKEMVKVLKKRCEEAKVVLRNIRRDTMEDIRKMQKNSEITQDEEKKALAQLQKSTDVLIAEIDNICKDKESEIMEI